MDKIIGLGNALVDALVMLDDDNILAKLGLRKGAMTLIDREKYGLISEMFSHRKAYRSTGGSAGNAMTALASMGAEVGFVGKVGRDENGRFFGESLEKHGIESHLLVDEELPSGVASTFIATDGERTFGSYLGAAALLKASDFNLELFKGYAYLLVEGYLVQDHDAILQAIELARQAGLQVCIDLSSCNLVEAERDFFTLLINKYVDIVLANEEEAQAFTGQAAEQAVDTIGQMCSIAIVKRGARGALIRKGTERIDVPAVAVSQVVDTTGAGDFFAAGFLYGLVSGCPLPKCGLIGATVAAEVVQIVGTTLPAESWERINRTIHQIKID